MPDARRYRQPRRARGRIALVAGLAVLLVGGALLAFALTRSAGKTELPLRLSMVGDSLNVAIEPYLAKELPGWGFRRDDVVGRTTAEGVAAMRAMRPALGPRVLVSLGTNDASSTVDAFRASVREALAIAGPDRCVVWFTIFRSDDPTTPLNDVLRDEAASHDNLHLVDWVALVRRYPEWLGPDGIHATEAGYVGRAAAAAEAVRSC